MCFAHRPSLISVSVAFLSLSIQTPQFFAILYLKFEQVQFAPNVVSKNSWMSVANSVESLMRHCDLRHLVWVYIVCSGLPDQIHIVKYNKW